MSHQLTFADSEFSTKRRQTRKEIFLSRMEQILPWQNMTAVIEPFYKTAINIEYMKASIRARGEHPFRIIKRQFGFVKARYKGLLKNDNQLAMLFTLANLFRVDQMIRQWERSQ
ncbi:transposase [Salmonella enterica]|uniref:transposase n=1 Tax=Salmonella enterica TaxID=28901 RepID=UPI0021C41F01|nr:transposase [Salmonella enterica]